MERKLKGTPLRLPIIFQRLNAPLYFVTINTLLRRPLLANDSVHTAFRDYAERGLKFNVTIGRYVLMPDHLHLFVRIGPDMRLQRWESGLKKCLDNALLALGQEPTTIPGAKLKSFWQPGFFDHLLRQDESYSEKWNYVWHNPVRAGLVARPEDWRYQGEIHVIDRV
jgi:putative transposase